MIKIKERSFHKKQIVELGKNPDDSYYFKLKNLSEYEIHLITSSVKVEVCGQDLYIKMFKLSSEYNEIYVLASTKKEIDLSWLAFATIEHKEIIGKIRDIFFQHAVDDVKIIEAEDKEDERK